MKINLEESLINYLYKIRTKDEIVPKINDFKNKLKKTKSYEFYSRYLTSLKDNDNLNFIDENDIFLIKYKEYKIDAFPLPSNFNKLNLKEKSLILENNISSFKYTLSDENIELIYLINELRVNNNLNKLICNKNENLNDFFREKNSKYYRKYLFNYSLGEFKTKLLSSFKEDKYI